MATLVDTLNPNGYLNNPAEASTDYNPSSRFASGLILPPPEIKGKQPLGSESSICVWILGCSQFASSIHVLFFSIIAIIDRTAQFIAKSSSPGQFEDKIRENQRNDPKFTFLNPIDSYHAYYRHRVDRIAKGDLTEESVPGREAPTPGSELVQEVVDVGIEPPEPEFILNLPSISAIDLYVYYY